MKTSMTALSSEVAVVLGGGLHDDGTLAEATLLRAEAAANLANLFPDMTVIVSGDGRNHKNRHLARTEAAMMADLLTQRFGIDDHRLLLEDESRDTLGNAVLVAARYLHGQNPRRLYIVTSPFHAQRSLTMFRGVLPETWPIAVHMSGKAHDDDKRAATESGGIEFGRRFFTGITPGDLKAVIQRMKEQGKPFYRTLSWLENLQRELS